MLSVSCSRCAFPIPRDTEALLLLLLLLLLPTVIYRSPISRSDISLLFSARLAFSFFFSPGCRLLSLSFSPLPVPLYPLYFLQRARAIGILTTREGALSSPRYPDPDGCEISRTRLARAVNRVDYFSLNAFPIFQQGNVCSPSTIFFFPFSFVSRRLF